MSTLAVETSKLISHTSTWSQLQELVQQEGIASLYQGLVPVLQSLCVSNFVYFYTFHSLKAIATPKGGSSSALRDLFLGTVAGVINVLSTTPFWVVNTRLKNKSMNDDGRSVGYSNLLEGLSYIWRNEGAAGLWAGTIPSLMLVSNPALQFMMYETLKERLVSQKPSAYTFFMIGALAKAFATVMTYPLQLVQTRLRSGAKDAALTGRDVGVLEMMVHIIKADGFAGLFRGIEAKLLQTVLTAALMFATYEKIAAFVMSLLIRSPKIRK